jgi:hypothetical protein
MDLYRIFPGRISNHHCIPNHIKTGLTPKRADKTLMIDLFLAADSRPRDIVNETLPGWARTKCVFTNLADLNYGPDPGNSAAATVQFMFPNERLELKAYDPSSNALLPPRPGFTAPPADLWFLIEVRFDGKTLLAPLTKLVTGSGTP